MYLRSISALNAVVNQTKVEGSTLLVPKDLVDVHCDLCVVKSLNLISVTTNIGILQYGGMRRRRYIVL